MAAPVIADRERWLARTFIELADTLGDEFDLRDLLHRLLQRAMEFLGAVEAGIVLVDGRGRLEVVASTSPRMGELELLEVEHGEGPCFDSYSSGEPIRNALLDGERWPSFAPRARALGFRCVHALPLRHDGEIVGALNLFHVDEGTSSTADLDIVQSLTDIVTLSVLHHRAMTDATTVAGQLQQALQSRVKVEQAKGVVAERLQIDVDEAFDLLRRYARNSSERLADVAGAVVSGALPAHRLLDGARRRGRRSESQGGGGADPR